MVIESIADSEQVQVQLIAESADSSMRNRLGLLRKKWRDDLIAEMIDRNWEYLLVLEEGNPNIADFDFV